MNSRERLLATIKGEPTDHVPVAPFIHSNAVREWKRDPNADVVSGTVEMCTHYGFDCILRNFNVRHNDFEVSTPMWNISKKISVYGKVTTTCTTVKTPEAVLTQTETSTQLTPNQAVAATVEYLLKTPEDFEILRRFQPPPVAAELHELRRAKTLIAQSGVCAPWVSGVFNYMASLRKLDDLLADPYLEPEFYADFADYCLQRLTAALEPILTEGVDFFSYAGNIAGGMVGPAFFEEYVLPYEKRLIDYIQDRCLGVIYHNCGDADKMIYCYNQLLPAVFESMTEPPYADNSLEKCLREFDSRITLMGNIDQINFLRNASASEVLAKAKEISVLGGKRGRFILGTSDFLEENTPHENLYALAQAVNLK